MSRCDQPIYKFYIHLFTVITAVFISNCPWVWPNIFFTQNILARYNPKLPNRFPSLSVWLSWSWGMAFLSIIRIQSMNSSSLDWQVEYNDTVWRHVTKFDITGFFENHILNWPSNISIFVCISKTLIKMQMKSVFKIKTLKAIN